MALLPGLSFATAYDEFYLTEFTQNDAQSYAMFIAALDSTDSNGFLSGGENSMTHVTDTITRMVKDQQQPIAAREMFHLAIRNDSGHVVGIVKSDKIEEGTFEMAYATHPSVQGQGIMSAAVAAYVTLLADQGVPVKLIEGRVLADNVASKTIIDRFGFMYAGEVLGSNGRMWETYYAAFPTILQRANAMGIDMDLI